MDLFDLRLWHGFQAAGGDPSVPAYLEQITIDSRRIESPDALFVALAGCKADGHHFISRAAERGAKFALVKFGTAQHAGLKSLYVKDPLTALQEIAGCYRKRLNTKVVCIAGSYGKTMVKDLLHALMGKQHHVHCSPESFNSQIGVPLSLLGMSSNHTYALIEAGFSHPGEALKLFRIIDPDMTILTHLGNKHLDTLTTMETAAAEMAQLQPQQGITFAPNHPLLKKNLKGSIEFWDEPSLFLPHALTNEDGAHFNISFPDGNVKMPLKIGRSYFIDLVNLAIKPAYKLGVSKTQIQEVLSDYFPEPSRTETWQVQGGATVINEIYSSDPQSIDIALRHFQDIPSNGEKYFFFGGIRSDKEIHYKRIGLAIGESKPHHLCLFGNFPSETLAEHVRRISPDTSILRFATLPQAIQETKHGMRPGDLAIIKGPHKIPLDTITESFQGSIFTNQCYIHLGAVASNIKNLRKKLPPNTRLMVMVKAHAYGTSDVRMAHFLSSQGIDFFGVSYVDEAISLRREGIKKSVFVLNAAPYETKKVVDWDFEIAISNHQMISLIQEEALKQNKKIKLHLHIDTGMSRLGCRLEEALQLAREITKSSHLTLEGVMTHFASADDASQDSFTKAQAERFDDAINLIESSGISVPWKHACNTSGVLRFPFNCYNMARIGLGIYGLAGQGIPAISLTSRIVGINHCKKGETISYGRNYIVKRAHERIAVIPIGYFDGLHLNYSSKGEVMIHGVKAPIVGRICMDYLMTDITHIPKAVTGDSVLIFGEDEQGHSLPPQELAHKGGSNVYELITCLGPRIQRIFINEDDHRVI